MTIGVVDTTVLVDLLRQYPPALHWFRSQPDLDVTPVTWMELVYGAQDKFAQLQCTKLLARFKIAYLTQADMDWAMQQLLAYRLSHNVGLTDCLIASVSHRLQVPLYTHNLKHIVPVLGAVLTVKPY